MITKGTLERSHTAVHGARNVVHTVKLMRMVAKLQSGR